MRNAFFGSFVLILCVIGILAPSEAKAEPISFSNEFGSCTIMYPGLTEANFPVCTRPSKNRWSCTMQAALDGKPTTFVLSGKIRRLAIRFSGMQKTILFRDGSLQCSFGSDKMTAVRNCRGAGSGGSCEACVRESDDTNVCYHLTMNVRQVSSIGERLSSQ